MSIKMLIGRQTKSTECQQKVEIEEKEEKNESQVKAKETSRNKWKADICWWKSLNCKGEATDTFSPMRNVSNFKTQSFDFQFSMVISTAPKISLTVFNQLT